MSPAGNNQDAHGVRFSSEPVKQGEAPEAEPGWLTEFEKLAEVERLARLDTDRQLVEELRTNNFSGVHWDYYATELVKYGLAVITGWTARGLIFEKVKRHSFGGLPQPADDALNDYDTAASLAGEVVAVSLTAFREKVLIPGVWDPAKGASIKTFFVGQCLKQFPNIYRRWHTETYDEASQWAADIDDVEEHHLDRREDISVAVAIHDEVNRGLEVIADPRVKEAYVLWASGHTHEQIGRRFGVTTKAVERMIYNERKKRIKRGDVA